MGREPVTAHQQQNSAVREDSGIFFSVCRKDHGPAMLKNAPIILDEAAANVAPENGKKLMDAIEAMTREKTVITRVRRRKTVRCRTASAAALSQSGDGPGAGKFNQKGDGREPPTIAFFPALGV